ncbi:tRNA wybutosine-synthesizing protein [Sphaerulina musiva]
MDRAVEAWRLQYGIEKDIIAPLSKKLCKSYTVYGCMLLLPQNALEGPEWSPLEPLIHHNNINNNNTALNDLYKSIAKELKITHIASNKPIPLHHHPHPPPANVANTCNDNNNNNETTPTSSENILRAPINFTPLYGDFGPETCSQPHPTQEDFDKAFWVTAKQNGIYQVWAPRWTMFSRGNISEKARLLTLGSVREAVEDAAVRGGREGGEEEEEEEERELQPPGFAAIDLYAGIGYFAFSYLRAGADQVWCWDINPWSIEGLLRGAKANKWEASVYNNTFSLLLSLLSLNHIIIPHKY